MRVLFAGTPAIAVPSLKAITNKFPIVGVLTAPDKVSGRGQRLTAPAVKTAAEEMELTVLQPQRLDEAFRTTLGSLNPDILVTFAYGKIFGPKFLRLFPLGGINLHPSALPLYRGPSPLTAAILAGDSDIVLTIQKIALEMDSGDILRRKPWTISRYETTGSLMEKTAELAAEELTIVLDQISSGPVNGYPQDSAKATYCRKIMKEDGRIDWGRSAIDIERMVRAYQPWPKAQTNFLSLKLFLLESHLVDTDSLASFPAPPGAVLGVDKPHGILIQTGDGVLGVTRIQAAGRKPMDSRSFLNGMELEVGMRWGVEE